MQNVYLGQDDIFCVTFGMCGIHTAYILNVSHCCRHKLHIIDINIQVAYRFKWITK